ncbi:erythromycin esterase family protein [Allokutzneria oryzae]|uniref:Erythromycin esterase family protein n=1 Tax=Allokutzneria oryzae TaxID=1378989 RepID=A0ABV5ZUJ5_9PSEU
MTITDWLNEHAHPVAPTPSAESADLLPLGDLVGDAVVVALSQSSRQARELSLLSHRILRFLVEHKGFRSVVLEGDDMSSVYLDDYVRSGVGDPEEILAEARSFWRTEEILGMVRWVRSYNERHPGDPVRIAHPSHFPAELGSLTEIERLLAQNTIKWHDSTKHKIVYWGGTAHVSKGDPRTVSPSTPTETSRNAGGWLRERFGSGFVSIGMTFHHGDVPYRVPAPPAEFAESALGDVDLDAFFLDLRGDHPAPVDAWLHTPTKTRLIGPHYDFDNDADHHLAGGSFAGWFDVVFHVRQASSVRLIG